MCRKIKLLITLVIGGALLTLSTGCSAPITSYRVADNPGEQQLAIEASSFAFTPNRITASAGSPLLLSVKNTAGMDHNLTIEAADATILLDLELPAGATTTARLKIDQPGEYRIYCNRPMHPTLGMTGQLVIE